MTKIFTKLRALVDEALSDSDTTGKKESPVQQVPLEQDLFDHRLKKTWLIACCVPLFGIISSFIL